MTQLWRDAEVEFDTNVLQFDTTTWDAAHMLPGPHFIVALSSRSQLCMPISLHYTIRVDEFSLLRIPFPLDQMSGEN